MLLSSVAVVAGFIFLVWGADRFVLGASATARNFGISPLIVGLTIVGFGTSAPEMLVSGMAAYQGNPGISIGNALGSNITNIALVLGITALIVPLTVHSGIIKRELPILLLVMVLALLLMMDGYLGQGDGLFLLLGMFLMIFWVVRLGLKERDSGDPMSNEFDAEIPEGMPTSKATLWLVVGMVVLFVSSQILVWGAVNIAKAFGVSDLIIGLTIIAIGTSLPELAATVTSALKKEHELAIGNIIGSNMFNILGVMALPGLIYPSMVPDGVLTRDYPVMIGLTIALFLMAYGFRGKDGKINRVEGGLLLSAFCGYMYWLYLVAV
ncbi:MAG: calcium/sodium antiporter [Gammaproteobacteria bacterium]|nr:calcium/sodium antiporter [Gammaproteobacteria bacterium]